MKSYISIIDLIFAILALSLFSGCAEEVPAAKPKFNNDSNFKGAAVETDELQEEAEEDSEDGDSDNEADEDEDENDEADDIEDKDDDDDKRSPSKSALSVVTLKNDNEGSRISVKTESGLWQSVAMSSRVGPATISNICLDDEPTKMDVKFTHPRKGDFTLGSPNLAVLSATSSQVTIGFEEGSCEGDRCQDDDVFTLFCSGGISIDN